VHAHRLGRERAAPPLARLGAEDQLRHPLTHGIAAARAIANGASISAASDLLLKEFAIGGVYLVIGLAMLRFFEFEGRRTASLETF
jgi:hypothetical protein